MVQVPSRNKIMKAQASRPSTIAHRAAKLLPLTFLFALLPIFGFAQEEVDASRYKIYDVAKNKEISFADLAKSLKKVDVVFFGEEHDDSLAHALQVQLLEQMHVVKKGKLALSLEMFQTDVQLTLDEYMQGIINEKQMLDASRPWKTYNSDYRPMVEFAKANNLYVLAANAPAKYTNMVTRGGLEALDKLSDAGKAYLAPLPIDTLAGRYHEKFADLLGAHASMGTLKLYQSQNLWDATMAWQIAKLRVSKPDIQILHINGRFHSDEKLGTYAQLQKYDPRARLANISCFRHHSFDEPEWDTWAAQGDYIILSFREAEQEN